MWSQEKKQCAIELLSFEAYRNDTAAELKAHINANQWLEQEHKRLRQELEAIKAVSKESESNLIGKHSQAINEISRLNSKLNMLQ